MELTIDFSNVNDCDWDTFHTLMVSSFKLPSFCGKNGNAYVDCLSSLRYPEDCMTEISLSKEEVLELTLINTKSKRDSVEFLLEIIRFVNERYLSSDKIPPIVVKGTVP